MKHSNSCNSISTEETKVSVHVGSSSAVKRKQNKENESPTLGFSIKRKMPTSLNTSVCKQTYESTPEKKMRHNTHALNEIECAKLIVDLKQEKESALLNISSNQIDLNNSDLKPQLLPFVKLDTSSDDQSIQEQSGSGSPPFDRSSTRLASPPAIKEFTTNQDLAAQLDTIQQVAQKIQCINETESDSEQIEAWKENYELLIFGYPRESIINNTPSKILPDNITARVYHCDEQVINLIQLDEKTTLTQANMEKSFTSPLETKNSSNNHANSNQNLQNSSCHAHSSADDHVQSNASAGSHVEVASDTTVEETTEPDESTILEFACNLLKTHFSENEIKTGIFGDKNNVSRSKTRQPFSIKKTQEYKSKLIEQFSLDEEQLEVAWNQWIRVKLNIKLGQLRRKIK